jgi:4-amino-4-deoxy-L-arabinose transferase-like glycosyltransferase
VTKSAAPGGPSEPSGTPSRRSSWGGIGWPAVIAVTLAAFALRALRLANPPLTIDEYATWAFSSAPLSRLLGPDYWVETNPPLYYLLMHSWLALGDSAAILRAPSLLFGSMVVPLTYALGRPLVGRAPAFVACVLVATSDRLIFDGRDARVYSLLAVLVLGALACFAALLRRWGALDDAERDPGAPAAGSDRVGPAWPIWLGYVGLTTAALYSHNTAVLMPALASLLVVVLCARRRLPLRFLGMWVLSNAAVLVLFSPWLLVMLRQVKTVLGVFWIPSSTWPWVRSQLLGLYPVPAWSKPVIYLLPIAGAWLLRRRAVAAGFLLTFAVGQPLLLLVASLYRPIFYVRPMVWTVPLGFLLAGVAVTQIGRRLGTAVAVVVTVVVAAVQMTTLPAQFPEAGPASEADGLVEPLRASRPGADVLVVAPASYHWMIRHATRPRPLPEGYGLTFGDRQEQIASWYGVKWIPRSQLVERTAHAEHVWLVLELAPRFPPAPGDGFEAALASLEPRFEVDGRWRSGDLELVRYRRRIVEPAPER